MTAELPIETFSLPTPYAVGPVNAYALVGEPMTMIDAGVNTVDAENALKLGFASKGLFIESVERILITHGHPDHYGLVPVIKEASNAEAFMGQEEIERITDTRVFWELGRLLLEAGFPGELLSDMAERERRLHRVHQVTRLECQGVKEGDAFEFDEYKLLVIDLAGHTGGHLGYYEEQTGTLFGGDTLLPHVSPNPLLEPILEPECEVPSRRRRSLKQYLESLDRLEKLDLKIVYPGHGPAITNPYETISYMREHHARRLEVMQSALDKSGKSAYHVSTELYPNVNG
ncbi:MAG TPA: MBL fold metallo-hydrolase, partial [Actinomycetota bacterium]|nr:MBL fold metallo-hydrolase [Actinomycetota bacterium]